MKDIKNPITLIGVDGSGKEKRLVMDADYALKFLAENYPDQYISHAKKAKLIKDFDKLTHKVNK